MPQKCKNNPPAKKPQTETLRCFGLVTVATLEIDMLPK